MATYQTSAQNQNSIRFGSAKIEIGATVDSLTNIGLVTGIEFTEEYTPLELKPDNGAPITLSIKDHTATVKFDMWELDMTNLALIRGGIDSTSSVAAAPVSVTDEAHTLTGTGSARLTHKNGDGTEVGSIVVTDASGNAAVRNTDYVISVDSGGYTNIARVSGSSVISTGEGVLVDYSYTPYASKTLSTGGLSTIAARVVRLTNLNSAGKKFEVTIYSAKNQSGVTFSYPADDAEDPLKPSMTIKGVYDTTRTAGDQLFKIVDEQGVTA